MRTACLFALLFALSLVSATLVEDEFEAFQKKYGKVYASMEEYQARLSTFQVCFCSLFLYFCVSCFMFLALSALSHEPETFVQRTMSSKRNMAKVHARRSPYRYLLCFTMCGVVSLCFLCLFYILHFPCERVCTIRYVEEYVKSYKLFNILRYLFSFNFISFCISVMLPKVHRQHTKEICNLLFLFFVSPLS